MILKHVYLGQSIREMEAITDHDGTRIAWEQRHRHLLEDVEGAVERAEPLHHALCLKE